MKDDRTTIPSRIAEVRANMVTVPLSRPEMEQYDYGLHVLFVSSVGFTICRNT